MYLSESERERYRAQISMEAIGVSGQIKLKAARVLIVGAGGLGVPLALQCTAAGVGTIGLVDADTIALSNLPRQYLYTPGQVGQKKVDVLKQFLIAHNPAVRVIPHAVYFEQSNATRLMADYDMIIDATDALCAKYCISDVAYAQQKTCLSASVSQFSFQCIVLPAETLRYRDIFPEVQGAHIQHPTGIIAATATLAASLLVHACLQLLISRSPTPYLLQGNLVTATLKRVAL